MESREGMKAITISMWLEIKQAQPLSTSSSSPKTTINTVYRCRTPAGVSLRQDITTGYPNTSHLQKACQTLILKGWREK